MNYNMINGKYFKFTITFLFLFLFCNYYIYSQINADSITVAENHNSKRLTSLIVAEGAFMVGTYAVFNYMWYKDYEKSSFHFFNDGMEWRGIDKMGHACGSYWLSQLNARAFEWTGLRSNKSAIYGTLGSFLFMSTIEVFDGFSKEWGASGWDLAADAGGSALFLAQELTLHRQIVMLKYSYYPSNYSKFRPDELGSNLGENMLKDYNATNFWLSLDLNSIISKKIPEWLNLAVGYGATGMTGGFENYISPGTNIKIVPDSERASRFYLSTDIDLSKIKVKSKFLRSLFYTLNFIKMPGPTIGYTKKGWMFGIR